MASVPPPQQTTGSPAVGARVAPGTERPGSSPRSPWRMWTAPAAILTGLGLGQVAVVVVAGVGQALGGSTFRHPSPAVSILSDVVADLAFVAAAVYFSSAGGRARPRDFGFRPTAPGTAAGLVVLAGIAYYLVTWAYASLLGLRGQDKLPSELGVHHSSVALAGAAVFVCVIAPIAEEFFFRGFLFSVLSQWRVKLFGRPAGVALAAVVVGILFGLAHTGSAAPRYLIPLGFLGFVLCLLRWRTGSLYPCLALHSFNNSLALGVNELHWQAGSILALIVGALVVIGLLTAPLAGGRRLPALGSSGSG